MKKVMIVLLVLILIVAAVGFYGYQKFNDFVTQIKTGDQYYEAGKYKKALTEYEKANDIFHTSKADERIKLTKDKIKLEKAAADSVKVKSDSLAVAVLPDSTTKPPLATGPAVNVNLPAPLAEQDVLAFVKTKKFTHYGNLEVLTQKTDQIDEGVAAQIINSLFTGNKVKLQDNIKTWGEVKISLYTTPEKYQKNNYELSTFYAQIDKEKIKFVNNSNHMFFQMYLDQMEQYTLFSLLHTRKAIQDVVMPFYDKLAIEANEKFAGDELKTKAYIKDSMTAYINELASALKLRYEQIANEVLKQAKADIII